MGVSDSESDKNGEHVVDLSARGIQKLDPSFNCSEDTRTLILDRNNIMKLDQLEQCSSLQQLSVANNRLVRMMGVSRLTELNVLNLPNNSIGYIEGLRDLQHLKWLNLSGNNIKVIEQLNHCVSLQHLDLSDNNICAIGDLTKLVALKTLLLHGNSITTLRTVPAYLPAHLSILSLAENEIRDLNEVSYLAPLHELEQLSIMCNPCVMATPSLPSFDYRPFVMSWCLSLKVLDGYAVTQKEGLRAEWLYSQGKGRSYRPGQHLQLVQYLATVCPLTASPALETAEDAKLEKILSKQRFHQRQLLEESQGVCPSPPRPTQLDVERHSPSHVAPQRQGIQEVKENVTPAPSVKNKEPVVQLNTWVSSDSTRPSVPMVQGQRLSREHVYLEDVQTDEEKLNSSLLSSESTFLPFTSDLEPQSIHTDSEDETETFEPDSLAPQGTRSKKHNTNKTNTSPLSAKHQLTAEEEAILFLQRNSETTSDLSQAEMSNAPKEVKVGLLEAEQAAVRIQSWWRGHYTRRRHSDAIEVRDEIRLRRMQEHIVYLSEKLDSVQKLYEEERLQRLVQEEAVKFLWKEFQSMREWKQSVEQTLAAATNKAHVPSPALKAEPPVCCSNGSVPSIEASIPDSGFQSTCDQQAAQEDSFLSSGTADSLNTVRALSPAKGSLRVVSDSADSADCSLLEEYLSSVQQRDEEAASDGTETPQRSSAVVPSWDASAQNSPLAKAAEYLSSLKNVCN